MGVINARAYRESVAGIKFVLWSDIASPLRIFTSEFKVVRSIVIAIHISCRPRIADRLTYVYLICVGPIIPVTITSLWKYD